MSVTRKPADSIPDRTTAAKSVAERAPLAPRKREAKRPFSTQLRPNTIERLEWMKAQGYSLTDVVDAAVNAYLDDAGVPSS